jgi:hypothetical protein
MIERMIFAWGQLKNLPRRNDKKIIEEKERLSIVYLIYVGSILYSSGE